MEFGIQFFPAVRPADKSGQQYWNEALHLTGLCDELGYTSVRTVEHYFHPYGGYTPNPMIFLTAAAMRTARARLITGAVLPVFNHPLKLAGEIGMLDAISNGRLEVGFARAFLPHEFIHFGVTMDESRARFEEGMEQVRLLLAHENVTHEGQFHRFCNVTSLPRPTQQPHPPLWVAALATPESFERAGRQGYNIMAIPLAGGQMADLLSTYRQARAEAGHPEPGRAMLAFHMLCHTDHARAVEIAREPLNRYLKLMIDGAKHWLRGNRSADYPGYDKIIASLEQENFATQVAKGAAWVGEPAAICDAAAAYAEQVGGIEIASLQVNFNTIGVQDAERSMRLFAEEVMPHFRRESVVAS